MKKLIFLLSWSLITALLLGSLHASHVVQWKADESLIYRGETNLWSVHHVLSGECKCSQTIAQYLLRRGPQFQTSETVTWVGSADAITEKLEKRGYRVQIVTAESIRNDLPVGVPFFAVQTPEHQTVYTGGYSSSQIRSDTAMKDLEILASFRGGQNVASLPIYGCTVSQKFQKQLDPFSLKYRRAGL